MGRKKEKNKKTAKKKTKKENLFCNPFRKTQMMILLQYLEPAHFDKMSLFHGKGEIFSQKRQMKVILSFNIKALPICLEGFGNRTEHQSRCDAQLFEIDSSL